MTGLPVPCLSCGEPTTAGSYCPACKHSRDRERDRRRGTTVERFGSGWARISRAVIERDGGICHICGEPGADTADHLRPRSLGGNSSMANLKAAHRACNSRRTNTVMLG